MKELIAKLSTVVDFSVLGNPLGRWALAVLAGAAVWLLLQKLKNKAAQILVTKAASSKNPLLKVVSEVVRRTNRWCLFFLSLWGGANLLSLPENVDAWIEKLAMLALFLQAALWLSEIIEFVVEEKARKAREVDIAHVTGIAALRVIAKFCLWTVVLLLVLSNFGIDISSLVAGLGIGGVAVALAVQNILGDLLCSVSILLDEPFKVGDFIVVDDKMGVVEQIGIKSTRIKSLSGEQLVFSNSDLISSRIRNYKRMLERRALFTIGVTYQTPLEALEGIPSMIKEIIENQEKTRFDRAHFRGFGAFSLDFEIVYYVLSAEYNVYMDIQQTINLEICRRFSAQGIEFAYPTQTLYLEKSN